MRLLRGNIPKWVVFLIDFGASAFSILIAYLLRFNFHITQPDLSYFPYVVLFVLLVKVLTFYLGKTYAGIIRYTSFADAQRLVTYLMLSSVVFLITNIVTIKVYKQIYIPTSVIIIEFLTSTFTLVGFRVFVKLVYYEVKNPKRIREKILVYGAADEGILTLRALERDAGTKFKVVGILEENKTAIGKKLEGIKIYPLSEIENLIHNSKISQLIIASKSIRNSKKQEIANLCLKHNIKLMNTPPIENWINGELSLTQIKKIKIEELLLRDEIQLDIENIKNNIENKVVLISGAAGSIGSEIVRQVIGFKPKKVILLDQAESSLFDIEMEYLDRGKENLIEVVVADIVQEKRIRNVFDTFKPQVVFHAAAYKHVPLMEDNPSEAILNNVLGTKILADWAHAYNTQIFVMISTDKAVNPTNVMGASKRIAEIYIQSLNNKSNTKYITTRFGNVLGSNGSVIPRFTKQIENGGPITITHPDITRFFMTITEACQLVLEAAAMGKGGEIFVFDMGKPVKILDLAKNMIKLSGLEINKDIQITFTGLRPGEKLYEELLNNGENNIKTHNEQITIAKVVEYDYGKVSVLIDELIEM
jgi:FlaA1/EpsC-like NDP-sugar epimerase